MASLPAIAAIATLAGGVVSAVGTIAAGNAQAAAIQQQAAIDREAAEFEAAQLDIRAQEERAAAAIEAKQIQRDKKIALSRLQALSAASGFSATDPTSLSLSDEIERFGTFKEQVARFGGDVRSDDLRMKAQATRFTGQQNFGARLREARATVTGARFGAAGTLLGSIGNAAGTFHKFRSGTKPAKAPVSGSAPLFASRF